MRARKLTSVVAVLVAAAVAAPASPALAAPDVTRVAGSDRIATAVALSETAHPDGAPAAVLALAWNFPDALASAPLAAAAGGPVLLNPGDRLDERVRAELERLGVRTVYLVGGRAALSAQVEADVAQLAGVDAERISGPDRFATAAQIAVRAVELWRAQGHADAGDHVIIALGAHADPNRAWPDALASGPLAAHARWPILLTEQSAVPEATQEALAQLGADEAVIVGGTAAIPEAVAAAVGGPGVAKRRIGGATRHHTSALLAEGAVVNGAAREVVLVATGSAFPDGLAAGPSAHAQGGVVLLTPPTDLTDAPHVIGWLADWQDQIAALRLVGGRAAISEAVRQQAQSLFGPARVRATRVASGLDQPVFVVGPPGDARLLVLEQPGRVRAVYPDGGIATFLDITGRVGSGGERGLLGLALHPEYASNRLLYLHYTNNAGNTVVAEFRAAADGATAGPGSERVIFTTAQPYSNHNGGMLQFGPDGHLYLALGDGGSGGDPQGHGQNRSTPLGALLRMDTDGGPAPGNPFSGGGGDARVWAYGLRNPWRFSFDSIGDRIYIADVGQATREEINVAPAGDAGLNYGWNMWEGETCFSGPCDEAGMTFPALDYATHVGGACSVTGGYVYRGRDVPSLTGQYVYSDYCAGWFRSFRYRGGSIIATDDLTSDLGSLGTISSFGTDARGELYIVSHSQGRVYRIDRR